MTLKEYLQDYASDATRAVGDTLILKELKTLNENMQIQVKENLSKIKKGERDFKF